MELRSLLGCTTSGNSNLKCPILFLSISKPVLTSVFSWYSYFLRPWDFPGNSTGVGCHFLLQGIFPTQRSNPGLLHYRKTFYRLRDGYTNSDSLIKFLAANMSLATFLKAEYGKSSQELSQDRGPTCPYIMNHLPLCP